ncbi:MAG: cyclodeaminase/cyclohydrolase family protein [Candidatus Omnitrophica bacterium]|nr:cyclodeaminase/cyclohydrolase family protein [Candidatus Omnitrophota bacterium]MDD5655074.1 cyclodeaminase/cyclohydrolase family protein [Candidatus Omnitrophota bacterium]
MYCDKTLREYLNDLAGRLPAPGGGSAAAMSAALGASLISMVLNFTIGKARYAEYEKELKKMLASSESLRNDFLRLLDLDVTAYRSRNVKESLEVPLKVCRLVFEGIQLCPPLVKKGNINLISDVAVAAVLLESGFAGAYHNIEINLKILNDATLTKKIRNEFTKKAKLVSRIRKDTEAKVGKVIRG